MSSAPDPDLPTLVVKSLVLYSVAEVQAGHATRIRVAVDGRRFCVSDDGRGHAIARQVDGVPYLRLVYDQFAFPFGQPEGPAVQLQGIATALIRGLCSEFTVTACRDGEIHRWRFDASGEFQSTTSRRADDGDGDAHGNTVEGTLRPALPAAASTEDLAQWLCEVQASVKGLTIELDGRGLAHRPPPGH